ncbi:NAD(P)-dependent oxidoreductase [Robertmurraya kyonggiensis]|uniref:precorrin-2 dehydrogenase n=1 Tax=Robertmurraya kyonggiensis TaxID=1037680 RepID=A0A4U1D9G4_9BACI|nr:NAD(P)-dependent oxidoreductase [Robertmurraya kyonggiensis]TKC19189.1 potassium transporter Trk [Robertmurraya kyonggiensis]
MQSLMIELTGKKVIIVGGGRIAARKAKTLAKEKASITFIALHFREEVKVLSEQHGYELIVKEATPNDLVDAFLVILATNDREANQALAESLSSNQLVCVVDRAEEGNVQFPATVRRGHLQLAISTGGASPKLTRKLKKELESQFDESWTSYLDFLAKCREIIKNLPLSEQEKNDRLCLLLDERYRFNEEEQKMEINSLEKIII